MPCAAPQKEKKDSNTAGSVHQQAQLSTLESTDPLGQVKQTIQNKIRNMEKRKAKLETYGSILSSGKELTAEQKTAYAQLSSVEFAIETQNELLKSITAIQLECNKQQKLARKKEERERQQSFIAKLRDLIRYQDVLNTLGDDVTRNDFLEGRRGAVKCTKEDLDVYDGLFKRLCPYEKESPDFSKTLDESAQFAYFLLKTCPKPVSANDPTTYAELKEKIEKLADCAYFDKKATENESGKLTPVIGTMTFASAAGAIPQSGLNFVHTASGGEFPPYAFSANQSAMQPIVPDQQQANFAGATNAHQSQPVNRTEPIDVFPQQPQKTVDVPSGTQQEKLTDYQYHGASGVTEAQSSFQPQNNLNSGDKTNSSPSFQKSNEDTFVTQGGRRPGESGSSQRGNFKNTHYTVVGFGLASYSILWEKGAPDSISQTVTNLYQSGRFALNPEERAQRIADVIMNADITFCKSFWNLTEGPFLQDVPKWFCPTMAVNAQWTIPATEPIFVQSTTEGFYIKITQPTAHTGPAPISIRVLSYQRRSGMENHFKDSFLGNYFEGLQPKSPNLLLHCHGGGFIATSSKTHEIYLRHWAKLLDCTVVSVDYSLAPEHPYPRAVEEVLYAYAWILDNSDKLGWTGERICFAGDSAGGHILMSITLRAIQMTMRRLPDGLVLIYAPFLIEYSPSPSRLLSFLDPLLPPGIMARCVAAYVGVTETVSNKDGCIVKSPLTSSKATLAEYAFNLKQQTRRSHDKDGNLPEYELNLGHAQKYTMSKDSVGVDFEKTTPISNLSHECVARAFSTKDATSAGKSMLKDRSGIADGSNDISSKSNTGVMVGNDKIINFCHLRNSPTAAMDKSGQDSRQQNASVFIDDPPSIESDKVGFVLETATIRSPVEETNGETPRLIVKQDNTSETPRHRPVISRQRSQSDTVVDFTAQTQKRLRAVDEIDELLGGEHEGTELTEEMVTVRIRKDPRRIVFSSGSYDTDFVEYLNRHELTGKSFVRLRVPSCSDKVSYGCSPESSSPSTSLAPTTATLASRRSRSTSSLSTQIGEKLGTVTGYVLDGLAFFMDTPTTTNAVEPMDFNLKNGSNDRLVKNADGSCSLKGVDDGATAPPPSPSSALTDSRMNDLLDITQRYGDVGASRLAHFHRLTVPRDPVLSPLRAEDELLAKLPRVNLVACHLDPLLDDSITFAKRLRHNKVRVTLDLLDTLPHGFLNFTIFSPECRLGAKQCLERIKDIFEN